MKIYKDSGLKNEVIELDFGILTAGESKVFTFYVLNDSEAELRNLNFAVQHKELAIIEAPKTLFKNTSAELKIKWSASITIKESLKAKLTTQGVEIWG